MKTMKRTLASLISVSCSLSSTTWAASADVSPSSARLSSVIDYENTSSTVGQMVSELQAFGTINGEEANGIRQFLAAQKVSLDSPVTKGSAQEHALTWGTARLTWNPDGSVKTQLGRIVRENPNQAKDAEFIETYRALTERASASAWYNFIFPNATADDGSDLPPTRLSRRNVGGPPPPLPMRPEPPPMPVPVGPANPIDAALAGIGRLITTVGYAVSIPVCGLTALPLDALVSAARIQGRVECRGGDFVMIGYGQLSSRMERDLAVGHHSGFPRSFSRELDPVFYSVCAAPGARLINDATVVAPRVLSAAFHGAPPRRCSPRYAHELGGYIETQHRLVERQALRPEPSAAAPPGAAGAVDAAAWGQQVQ